MSIVYLTYQEIDKLKWDTCIHNSFNGLLYAYSWYLDVVTEQWDALVEGDYERVMPLPYRRTMGFEQIYMPALAPLLGIFSRTKISEDTVKKFINTIPRRFKTAHIALNKYNSFNTKYTERKLLSMDLISVYDRLSAKYSAKTSERIAAGHNRGLYSKTGMDIGEFADFHRANGGAIGPFDSIRLASLAHTLISLKVAEIIAIHGPDGELLCAGLFIAHSNNATVHACSISAKGQELHAPYMMLDTFIRTNSNKNITLDFTPFNHRIAESFYTGFGCTAFTVKQYRHTSFVWPLNYIFR